MFPPLPPPVTQPLRVQVTTETRETLLAVGVLEKEAAVGAMVEEVMEEDVDAMVEDAVEAVEAVVVVAEEKKKKLVKMKKD